MQGVGLANAILAVHLAIIAFNSKRQPSPAL
jgi:hypothetical protein